MSLLLDISPADLGLPDKFPSYREAQSACIDFSVDSDKPFVAACAPTGIGKSLVAVTVAKVKDTRAVYLTSTKSLQTQILSDFSDCGMTDIRGKGNYSCRHYTEKSGRYQNCEHGQEHQCYLSGTSACSYTSALERAKSSKLISTNYSYWLHATKSADALSIPGGENIGLLICDEAHNAVEELSSFLKVNLRRDEYENNTFLSDLPATGVDGSGVMYDNATAAKAWRAWAGTRKKELSDEIKREVSNYGSLADFKKSDPELYIRLERDKEKCSKIAQMNDNWAWQNSDFGTEFEPIWPGRYSNLLWAGVPQVILLSATLYPYTLSLLGIPREKYDFKAFSNGWPKQNGLVYYIPTVKLSYKSDDAAYQKIVDRMDEIISGRLDRKGIIHTGSYARMRTLMERSKYSKYMLFNERAGDSTLIANRFRAAKAPAILISPSFSTGWDFAYDSCEYQIIPKTPFPYSESRVMQERCKDESYRTYLTLTAVSQMIGRGRRAADDRCETFILDNHFPGVFAKGERFMGKAFSMHKVATVPKAPEKLRTKKDVGTT